MIVVGKNLKELIEQFKICPKDRFDETGLNVLLNKIILVPNYDKIGDSIKYTVTDVEPFFKQIELSSGILYLDPGEIALCCSVDKIRMPNNYFGLVQTKGSLARLFVTVNVTDSQIDPGYSGIVTLEVVNFSPFKIEIPINSIIAKIYIYKCTTNADPYNGKYQNSNKPTFSKTDLM